MSETNKPLTQEELQKQKAELDNFRKQLLDVYNQLKTQNDFIADLKKEGITNIEDLKAKLSTAPAEKKDENSLEGISAQLKEENQFKENEDLKAEVKELKEIVYAQAQTIDTDKLISAINTEIKDKPEYALLAKALDPNIARNILLQQDKDSKAGEKKELPHYLQATEKQLREFYGKLGGKLEKNQELATPAEKKDDIVSFPSLPSASESKEESTSNPYKKVMLKGKDPITGKMSEDRAFEADLKDFLAEPIS